MSYFVTKYVRNRGIEKKRLIERIEKDLNRMRLELFKSDSNLMFYNLVLNKHKKLTSSRFGYDMLVLEEYAQIIKFQARHKNQNCQFPLSFTCC